MKHTTPRFHPTCGKHPPLDSLLTIATPSRLNAAMITTAFPALSGAVTITSAQACFQHAVRGKPLWLCFCCNCLPHLRFQIVISLPSRSGKRRQAENSYTFSLFDFYYMRKYAFCQEPHRSKFNQQPHTPARSEKI